MSVDKVIRTEVTLICTVFQAFGLYLFGCSIQYSPYIVHWVIYFGVTQFTGNRESFSQKASYSLRLLQNSMDLGHLWFVPTLLLSWKFNRFSNKWQFLADNS